MSGETAKKNAEQNKWCYGWGVLFHWWSIQPNAEHWQRNSRLRWRVLLQFFWNKWKIKGAVLGLCRLNRNGQVYQQIRDFRQEYSSSLRFSWLRPRGAFWKASISAKKKKILAGRYPPLVGAWYYRLLQGKDLNLANARTVRNILNRWYEPWIFVQTRKKKLGYNIILFSDEGLRVDDETSTLTVRRGHIEELVFLNEWNKKSEKCLFFLFLM